MKIGVVLQSLFKNYDDELFNKEPFENLLERVVNAGVQSIEFGTSYNKTHWHYPGRLLENRNELDKLTRAVTRSGLDISALNCGGNPLHPDKEIRERDIFKIKKTILLAERLNVSRANTFSGCPGSSEASKHPNWIIYDGMQEVLEWQWRKIAIPFWQEMEKFARAHNIKICLELHPCFLVYNCETFLRLRESTGENLGVNLDPSHFFWQGIDPIHVIHELGELIFHVHAKDTYINKINTLKNGVLDNKSVSKKSKRSWFFRTVGQGHDLNFWKNFRDALKLVGYDDVLSIEQEDPLIPEDKALKIAVKFLKEVLDY